MKTKYLIIALSVATFSSCSTAYKAGQTPDDVYYSPARVMENENKTEKQNEIRYTTAVDYEIKMGIRDYRWRDFRNDYEYRNSPYNYATSLTYNYGYYYNPYYYPWAIYTGKSTSSTPINTMPRMINLKAYTGYNPKVASGKSTGMVTWANQSSQYNNSNRSSTPAEGRQIFIPKNNNTSSSSNDTRSYTPASNSSSDNGSSGSVSRPSRGG